ncbi:hypothetical protein [Leekyejoonella antrihumi]|nr:hypothetical protein [Leekyejoonella antrihumi]
MHATVLYSRSADNVYSHWSAAVLWGMPVVEPLAARGAHHQDRRRHPVW